MDLERTGQETIDLSNKSATDTTILKIPKERDSLHKFAISKMLGITDEEEEGVPAKTPKLTRTYPEVKKVDENCNNVANSGMLCKTFVKIKSDFIIFFLNEIHKNCIYNCYRIIFLKVFNEFYVLLIFACLLLKSVSKKYIMKMGFL